MGVFSQNQGKYFQIRELFSKTISKHFNLRKNVFFQTVKPFFRNYQEIALNEAIFA